MFQPSELQECARCGGKIYNITYGFQKCNCGILPIEIIGSNSRVESQTPLSVQFRIGSYLKLACTRSVPDKLFRILSNLSLNTAYKLLGKGSIEEAQEALTADTISCFGNATLIPNLIAGEIVSGIWELQGDQIRYLEFIPGGLAFSFTLKEPARFVNQIFVFQNLKKALSLLLEIYSRYGLFVPIVAHPDLRILENVNWLPKREVILVVDEIHPPELRPLLPLNPRIIQADSCVQYEGSPYKLHYYYNKSEFLENIVTEYFAISPRYGIIVANNKWYYTPSGAIALNADIHVEKIKRYKSKKIYHGYLQFSGKKVNFVITEKNAYAKLKKIALQHGMNLYCAPGVAKRCLEIAAAKSRPETEEISRFGIQRNYTILLPNLVITDKEIIPEVSAVGKNLIAKNLRWVPNPFLHLCRYYKEDRGTISQLTTITSLLLLIGYSTVHRLENAALFLLTDSIDSVIYILDCCGIENASEETRRHLWPALYVNPEHLLVGPKKFLPITYGDYKYLALVMLHYRTLVANIGSIFVPLIPEDTIQHAFVFNLRKILEITKSTKWKVKRDVNKELLYAIHSNIIPNQAITQHIAKRIRFQFYARKRRAIALLVGRLLEEGYLNKSQIKSVNTYEYAVDLNFLNSLLSQIGLPPAIPINEKEPIMHVEKYEVTYAMNNPQGLFAGLQRKSDASPR